VKTVFQRVTGGRYGDANRASPYSAPPGRLYGDLNLWRRGRDAVAQRNVEFLAPNTVGGSYDGRLFFVGKDLARTDTQTLYLETQAGDVYRGDVPGPTLTLLTGWLGNFGAAARRGSFFQSARAFYYCSPGDVRGASSQETCAYRDAAAAAGVPKCLDARLQQAGDLLGAAGFLANNSQVAYRYVLKSIDSDGIPHQGEPSGRDLVLNTAGGPRDVARRIWLHPSAVAGWVLEVYRTLTVASSVTPSANFYKVQEYTLVAGDIAAGYAAINDRTPDSVLSDEPLYTNPSDGDGELAARGRPPVQIHGSAYWDNRAWYAGASTRQNDLSCRLLGVGAPDGLQAGDTITLAGVAFTAALVPAAPTDFLLSVGGTASQNIENTLRSLLDVSNANATVRATQLGWYVSGPDDVGAFEVRGRFSAPPTISISRATAWALGAPPVNAAKKWALHYSDLEQPEAVRVTSEVVLPSQPRTLVAVGGSLFVFLEAGGLYRVREGGEPYGLEEIDSTLKLYYFIATAHEGAVWAWTLRGLVRISEAGDVDASVGIEQRSFYPVEDPEQAVYDQSFVVSVPNQHRLEFWYNGAACLALNTEMGEWYYWTNTFGQKRGGIAWNCHPASGTSRSTQSASIYSHSSRQLVLERTALNSGGGSNPNIQMNVAAYLLPPVPGPGIKRTWRGVALYGRLPQHSASFPSRIHIQTPFSSAETSTVTESFTSTILWRSIVRPVPPGVAEAEVLLVGFNYFTSNTAFNYTGSTAYNVFFNGVAYSFEDVSTDVFSNP
jgi:hypothetical protein